MKAIIFDLDNTLIDWKDEFIFPLKKLLLEIYPDITDEKVREIDNVIDASDSYLKELNKEIFLQEIIDRCNIKLPSDFLDKLLVYQEECFYEDKELVETIKYLSSKYDLYVISNWFTNVQSKRLENVGLLTYFKKVIGADINFFKPDKRCFDVILNMYNPEECMYIGDNLNLDIIPAIEVGMSAIWKTKQKSDKYKTIESIYELKNIL